MSFQDVCQFANENQACFLSTTEGDQPKVRGFLMWFADETGVYFHTGSTKKVYKQLKENPKIEVCFYNPGSTPDAGKMLRITGEVEFLNDAKLQERLMSERPFLQDLRKARPDVEVVIHHCPEMGVAFEDPENDHYHVWSCFYLEIRLF